MVVGPAARMRGMDEDSSRGLGSPLIIVWLMTSLIVVLVTIFVVVGVEELLVGPGGPISQFYRQIGLWQPVDNVADGLMRLIGR